MARIDGAIVDRLIQTVDMARLLGASVIMTGLSREVSHALVDIGADFRNLTTLGDFRSGIEQAEHMLGYCGIPNRSNEGAT